MSTIVQMLLKIFVEQFLTNPAVLVKFVPALLDFVKKFVLGTASKIDDNLVLPVIKQIELWLSVSKASIPGQSSGDTSALSLLVNILVDQVFTNKDVLKVFIPMLLAFGREKVLGSESSLDDSLLLPVMGQIEKWVGVESSIS